jgi:transcriptional regulator with XRE-family HTH domain
MSAKVAHRFSVVVAENVKRWREKRNLDQQGLADRLAELGWSVDRTAITRIERGDRKVAVDDLGLLAVALNVPIPMLLLPVHTGVDVAATPKGETSAVNCWYMFESMLGNVSLPGRHAGVSVAKGALRLHPSPFGDEWRTGAEPLWLYERVRRAQRETSGSYPLGEEPAAWLNALRDLVDAVADMETAGYPADDLIDPARRRAVAHHKIEPSPEARRFDLGRGAEGDTQ